MFLAFYSLASECSSSPGGFLGPDKPSAGSSVIFNLSPFYTVDASWLLPKYLPTVSSSVAPLTDAAHPHGLGFPNITPDTSFEVNYSVCYSVLAIRSKTIFVDFFATSVDFFATSDARRGGSCLHCHASIPLMRYTQSDQRNELRMCNKYITYSSYSAPCTYSKYSSLAVYICGVLFMDALILGIQRSLLVPQLISAWSLWCLNSALSLFCVCHARENCPVWAVISISFCD